MRLFFLGTAAAEGFPGIFCNCAVCQQARSSGGKNLRLRSALLVNDDLLIDFGPDLLAAAQRFNLNLWGVTIGLVTHVHGDHFQLFNFWMRGDAFTGKLPPPTMHLYGSRDVAAVLEKNHPDLDSLHIDLHTVQAFDTWERGRYSFTAYRAHHGVKDGMNVLFYSLDDGQHAVLYATDTGRFTEDTRQTLLGRSFDVIVMEETLGHGNYDQHLGFESFIEQAGWMRSEGLLRPGGRIFATHFSHSGNPLHEELEAILGKVDVEVAYDGLEIVI